MPTLPQNHAHFGAGVRNLNGAHKVTFKAFNGYRHNERCVALNAITINHNNWLEFCSQGHALSAGHNIMCSMYMHVGSAADKLVCSAFRGLMSSWALMSATASKHCLHYSKQHHNCLVVSLGAHFCLAMFQGTSKSSLTSCWGHEMASAPACSLPGAHSPEPTLLSVSLMSVAPISVALMRVAHCAEPTLLTSSSWWKLRLQGSTSRRCLELEETLVAALKALCTT